MMRWDGLGWGRRPAGDLRDGVLRAWSGREEIGRIAGAAYHQKTLRFHVGKCRRNLMRQTQTMLTRCNVIRKRKKCPPAEILQT
ncbi:hypothetical protein NDU88_002114 [Pleurodeles waltl]|uniref:Uncharacterized protein n=1 Tax=Pleurodeles waltl TaxID=8319 RepID=A0AAV7VZQ8_PLEWA|nr:hypothetical protein NDU88_002114 [Pleurodeles waltl]